MTYLSFVKYECLALYRNKQSLLNALLFFVMVSLLFPLGVSSEETFLAPAAAGIVWCATLLAVLMVVDGLFKSDFNDGSLEQLAVSGLSFAWLMLLKVVIHWLATLIPLLLVTPLLGYMLFLPTDSLVVVLLSLLFGSPSLFLIGSIAAGLTLTLRQSALLMLLLILPFYLPVLVFATGAIKAQQAGLDPSAPLAILLAISLFSLAISPLLTAISLRASLAS